MSRPPDTRRAGADATDPPPEAARDPEAGRLLLAELPALRAFAVSLTRNVSAADDLVQDTLVRAWTGFHRFRPGTSLKAWLFTILRNAHFSNLRKRRREVVEDTEFHAARVFTGPAHDGRLAMAEFLAALHDLSPYQREALILTAAHGFTIEEVAAMTGVAPGTVKSRVSRARARLAELLGLAAGESPMPEPSGSARAVLGRSFSPAA